MLFLHSGCQLIVDGRGGGDGGRQHHRGLRDGQLRRVRGGGRLQPRVRRGGRVPAVEAGLGPR